jgi:septal ring factor EnvC (AmiA/AmiB activator)
MTRRTPLLLLAPMLVAASAPVMTQAGSFDAALKRARSEQAAAEADAKRLQSAARNARSEGERLRVEQLAAAHAIAAAEARITSSDIELRLIAAMLQVRRAKLQQEQRPIAGLLAGLAMMSQRPPLLAVADRASMDDLVKVRVLLDSTLPAIRARTASLSAELAEAQRLKRQTAAVKQELVRSRQELETRRRQFAALEQEAIAEAEKAGSRALGAGDVALAAGEDVERLQRTAAGNRAAWQLATQAAAADPSPARPTAPEGRPEQPPIDYRLPADAPVSDGVGEVGPSGIKSRGVTLATSRGTVLIVPASGVVRFSGPFRSHDGVVIIDHGNGWMSLILNVGSPLKVGERVRAGGPLGRALGPIGVELSQNGRRISPALIAGSSQTLSNKSEGG